MNTFAAGLVLTLLACQAPAPQTPPPEEPYWLDLAHPREGATGRIQIFLPGALMEKNEISGEVINPTNEFGRKVVLQLPVPARFPLLPQSHPTGRWQFKGFYRVYGVDRWHIVPVPDGQ